MWSNREKSGHIHSFVMFSHMWNSNGTDTSYTTVPHPYDFWIETTLEHIPTEADSPSYFSLFHWGMIAYQPTWN